MARGCSTPATRRPIGIWFGRDVAFTYGPIYQWLSSAPARWLGLSAGSIYATYNTLPLLVALLATFLTVRFLFPRMNPWKRSLLFALAAVFWSPPDVRVSVVLLGYAVFLSSVDDLQRKPGRVLLYAALAAIFCLAGFLLSADTGLYTSAALILCVAAQAGCSWKAAGVRKRTAVYIALAAACFAILMVLTNAVMFSPLDFSFWRSGLAIAGGYRWFEATAMTKANKWLLLETVVMAIVVFGCAWRWYGRDREERRQRRAFVLSSGLLAFLIMQTAIVRSDSGHVLIGIYPALFFCGAILIAGLGSKRALSALLVILVVAVTLVRAQVSRPFSGITWRWQQILHPMVTCPADYTQFDRACFPTADANLLASVSAYVDQHTRSADPIVVFPYETAFGMTSRRNVAGGVLQSYLVNGPYLTQVELNGLRKADPALGLYLPDGEISVAVDGIANFTRSPDVWFYLLRHYRAQDSPVAGVSGLIRDDSRDARIALQEEPVAAPLAARITRRNTSLDLGKVSWPAEGADFLKFRLHAVYPPWWRARKPSRLVFDLSFADGSTKSVEFLAEPNRSSDIWIYPWDDKSMDRYFSTDATQWRAANRPAVTGLKLHITPLDWISVLPSKVTIEEVNAVRVDLQR